MSTIGRTDLDVHPLCLGGNVFGWTADARTSFAVLDAYAEAGGNFIDTADVYSAWIPGNSGGESETIIGQWMRERGNRSEMVIATKVGMLSGRKGLGAGNIKAACADSLRRLQTDYIDLYYAHQDDADVPLEEPLAAFADLIDEGKVRHVAASNFQADRLEEAMDLAEFDSGTRYVALQPHYNLLERSGYEGELRDVVAAHQLSCIPYYGLASGFLTGKYQGAGKVDSPRAGGASRYSGERGDRVIATLGRVAGEHGCAIAAVALAWLAAQPTVASVIASARNPEQLRDLLAVGDLVLSEGELSEISGAAAG